MDYVNSETSFSLEFSRVDRNVMPEGGTINGTISDTENERMFTPRVGITAYDLLISCPGYKKPLE